MQGKPAPGQRGQFAAYAFLRDNKMCGAGHLIGAFEFHCSNPEGVDPKNPARQCPDPPSAVQDTATTKPDTTAGKEDQTTLTTSGNNATTSDTTARTGESTATSSYDNAITSGRDGSTATSSHDNAITSGRDVTTQVSGTSGHGSFLHPLVSVILLVVLQL